MSWLIILELLLIVAIVGLVANWLKNVKNWDNYSADMIKTFHVVCIAFLILLSIWTPISTYGESIALPYEYQCACDSVEESKELLMRYENLTESWGSLGQGLESFELKSTLQGAIITKNNLKADILGWLNNPWQPFRDVLSSNLPDDFYSN